MNTAKTFTSADLAKRTPKSFAVETDVNTREEIAQGLDISAIKKLRLEGTLKPFGKKDWQLEAKLGATVIQPCVVTLDPVTTRIDEKVMRLYLAEWSDPDPDSEVEIPEDDNEPLGAEIDLVAIMTEALSLALPTYPRADGAELGEAIYSAPGTEPMTDDDAKPFASLAKLKKDLEG